jgi:hypothetical protein
VIFRRRGNSQHKGRIQDEKKSRVARGRKKKTRSRKQSKVEEEKKGRKKK